MRQWTQNTLTMRFQLRSTNWIDKGHKAALTNIHLSGHNLHKFTVNQRTQIILTKRNSWRMKFSCLSVRSQTQTSDISNSWKRGRNPKRMTTITCPRQRGKTTASKSTKLCSSLRRRQNFSSGWKRRDNRYLNLKVVVYVKIKPNLNLNKVASSIIEVVF